MQLQVPMTLKKQMVLTPGTAIFSGVQVMNEFEVTSTVIEVVDETQTRIRLVRDWIVVKYCPSLLLLNNLSFF